MCWITSGNTIRLPAEGLLPLTGTEPTALYAYHGTEPLNTQHYIPYKK